MLASPRATATASWTESETLALRAALSVIDTWDGDLSVLLDDDTDSSGSDTSKTEKTPCKPRRRVRKQEIMALRAEAEELQYVVALGRALVGGSAAKERWARLANVQKQRRFTSELQNAKLRKLVQSQLNHCKRMLKMARQVDVLKHTLYVPPFPSFVNYQGPSIDPVTQLRSLDALVSRASMVFASGVFPTGVVRCYHQTEFLNSTRPEDGAELETQSVWMIPADVQRATGAMWMHTMRPAHSDKNSMDIYEDTNALVSQSMAMSNVDDNFGAFQGQVAARILPPDLGDGSVLIVAKMEAKTFVGSELRGRASFDCCIRIELVASQDETRTGPVSIVKRHSRMLMTHPSSDMTESERRQWTQAVKASPIRHKFDKEFDKAMEALESLLLTSPVTGESSSVEAEG